MARPVRVRRLTEQEGQKLQQVVRRGSTSSVRFRRAMMLLASAGGNTVPVIARLVQADEDTVRDVIHRFNEIGLACLNPQWEGGRPRLLSRDDEDFVIQTATNRPTVLGKPFTRRSVRKLVDHLHRNIARPVRIGREALRCLLARRGITFQRTKTWKESPDPAFDAKRERIEYALDERPDRTFAFDEFGPLGIRPTAGSCWQKQGSPDRLPATYRRTHGITYFHGCYSVGDDKLWGVKPAPQGHRPHLVALRTIRAARPDGAPIYVILENLSAHLNWKIRRWAAKNKVELCFTPTYASWANPIEAHFGPLRQFTLANSNHPNHTVQTRALHAYLRWRNKNARHPDVLAAQRRERARIRSERGIRWAADHCKQLPDRPSQHQISPWTMA
ncbi:IS630 family transposase [Streptomyces sp. NPDC054958]